MRKKSRSFVCAGLFRYFVGIERKQDGMRAGTARFLLSGNVCPRKSGRIFVRIRPISSGIPARKGFAGKKKRARRERSRRGGKGDEKNLENCAVTADAVRQFAGKSGKGKNGLRRSEKTGGGDRAFSGDVEQRIPYRRRNAGMERGCRSRRRCVCGDIRTACGGTEWQSRLLFWKRRRGGPGMR